MKQFARGAACACGRGVARRLLGRSRRRQRRRYRRQPLGSSIRRVRRPDASASAVRLEPLAFPGKPATKFSYARKDGRDAVAVLAASSASMLRSKIRIEPAELGSVRFSWNVPQLIAGADMALREADDSPVRVVLIFEGDRSRFSARDAHAVRARAHAHRRGDAVRHPDVRLVQQARARHPDREPAHRPHPHAGRGVRRQAAEPVAGLRAQHPRRLSSGPSARRRARWWASAS